LEDAIRYSGRGLAAAQVLLLLATAVSLADTLSVPLGPTAYVTGPIRGESRGRALIAVSLPSEVRAADIDFACIQIPSPLLTDQRGIVTVEAYALTTAWDPSSVTWTTPWRTPGGDMDSVEASEFPTWAGDSHAIWLDITSCARAWKAGRAAHGLVLRRPLREGGGFAAEGARLRQAIASARIKYWFSVIEPPRPEQ
jgi:hypothetical protein